MWCVMWKAKGQMELEQLFTQHLYTLPAWLCSLVVLGTNLMSQFGHHGVDTRYVSPKERFSMWRCSQQQSCHGSCSSYCVPKVHFGNSAIEVTPDLQGDLLKASVNCSESLGGNHKQQFTSSHLEIPPELSKPAAQQDWVWCWFWEGQPGGTSARWKLVALSLIGGEFNFGNEPGTFQFLIRFAQRLTQQIFTWQTARSIPVAVDWNHFCCYPGTGEQGHLKVMVAKEMRQGSNWWFSDILLGKRSVQLLLVDPTWTMIYSGHFLVLHGTGAAPWRRFPKGYLGFAQALGDAEHLSEISLPPLCL